MPSELTPLLLVLPALLVLSGFFSGSETAIFGLRWEDRTRLRRSSPRLGKQLAALLSRPRRLLIGVLLANMTINVVYFVLSSILLLRSDPLIGSILNVASLLGLILFGEVLPKLLAGSYRVAACRLTVPVLGPIFSFLSPLLGLIDVVVVAPLSRLIRPVSRAEPLTADELAQVIEMGGTEGALDADEQNLLSEVIALGQARVRDVMTPRVDMRWLKSNASPAAVKTLARDHHLTHIPLFKGSVDGEPRGILNVKRYLAARALGDRPRLRDCADPAVFVPETARLDRAMEQLRFARAPLALVVNEHGAVAGFVRVTDLVERLVGDTGRSAQEGDAETEMRRLGPGRWSVPGRLSVRPWADLLGEEATRRVSTVGGLVVAALGRMPQVGDEVRLGSVVLQVRSLDGSVPRELLMTMAGEQPHLDSDAAPAAPPPSDRKGGP